MEEFETKESLWRNTLGEYISDLIIGGNVADEDFSIDNLISNKVEVKLKVLCVTMKDWVGS